jgi:AbrB family looped-hinge helix DNA binding protein
MPKVTSKLQLTVPKAIAEQFGIRPGDELQWVAAGEIIRVIPPGKGRQSAPAPSLKERLNLFDKATQRQRRRQTTAHRNGSASNTGDRGWKREDLYRRGRSD